jgi:hypothetical protein
MLTQRRSGRQLCAFIAESNACWRLCKHTSSRYADAIAVMLTPTLSIQAAPPALPVRTADGTVLTEKTPVGPAGNCHFCNCSF